MDVDVDVGMDVRVDVDMGGMRRVVDVAPLVPGAAAADDGLGGGSSLMSTPS